MPTWKGSNPKGSRFSPIRNDHISPNPEKSHFCQSRRVIILTIRRVLLFANPEVSFFCQCGGVIFFAKPDQGSCLFANPERSRFFQSGRIFLPTRNGLKFVNPEGSKFCQSGRVSFLPIKKGPVFANPVEFRTQTKARQQYLY